MLGGPQPYTNLDYGDSATLRCGCERCGEKNAQHSINEKELALMVQIYIHRLNIVRHKKMCRIQKKKRCLCVLKKTQSVHTFHTKSYDNVFVGFLVNRFFNPQTICLRHEMSADSTLIYSFWLL
jgi:hypothetical protein